METLTVPAGPMKAVKARSDQDGEYAEQAAGAEQAWCSVERCRRPRNKSIHGRTEIKATAPPGPTLVSQ